MKAKNLKRSELPSLKENLTNNLKGYKGARLAYAVVKNIGILATEIETYKKMAEPSEGYKAFDIARNELGKEAAIKNEDGSSKTKTEIIQGAPVELYEFPEDSDVTEKFQALADENKEVIDEHTAKLNDFGKFLEEPCDLEVHEIFEKDLNDDLDGELMSFILPFIE